MTPALALVLGLGLLFAATLLVVLATGDLIRERRAVDRSLTAIRSMDAVPIDPRAVTAPFSERVIAPIGDQLINLGRLLTRQGAEERLQHRLDIAGNPRGWTVERIAGFKVLGMVVLAALGMVLVAARGGSFPVLVVIAIAFGTFGYLLPNLLLINAGQKREERMRNALPDALDLMTISVEAGLGFDAAMSRVAHDTKGPLAQEFSASCRRCSSGSGGSTRCGRWPTGPRSRSLRPSAWRWSRPTASACRSPGRCGCRPRRCGSRAASAPRSAPRRCR